MLAMLENGLVIVCFLGIVAAGLWFDQRHLGPIRAEIARMAARNRRCMELAQRVWERPSRHPEALARWTRVLMAPIDDELWLDRSAEQCADMLASWWNVDRPARWATAVRELLGGNGPLHAWDGLRAVRNVMAGARVGWISEAQAWELTGVIAAELAHRYRSFDEVWRDYLEGWRRWRGLEPGSTHPDLVARRESVGSLAHQLWLGQSFQPPPIALDAAVFDRASAIAMLYALEAI